MKFFDDSCCVCCECLLSELLLGLNFLINLMCIHYMTCVHIITVDNSVCSVLIVLSVPWAVVRRKQTTVSPYWVWDGAVNQTTLYEPKFSMI